MNKEIVKANEMKKNRQSIEERLYHVYRKHVKRYQHKDTNQMCCMWSIAKLPDEIYECDQIFDIENEFCITLSEDDALDIYDMHFDEAVIFIHKKMKENCINAKEKLYP